MNKGKKHKSKKYEQYYGEPYKPRREPKGEHFGNGRGIPYDGYYKPKKEAKP